MNQRLLSKSISSINPGIFCSSVKCKISYISRVFSPINLPAINPVWSVLINLFRTCFILFAMEPDAILYIVFSNVIGLQFLSFFLHLFSFGMHTIRPCC